MGTLPPAGSLDGAIPPGPRPSAYIEVTSDDRAGMAGPGDPEHGAAADYRVAIALSCGYVSGPAPDGSFKQALGMSVTMGTLCVVPCRNGHVDCRLTGVVTNRSGKSEKSYEVNESIESNIYGFYAIPVGLSRDAEVVLENEIRTLYRQMLDAHAFGAARAVRHGRQ
jgi:hypothetical protein